MNPIRKSVFYTKILLINLIVYLLVNPANANKPLSETEKIEALLEAIETSELTFIRNDKEYASKIASQHLREKWNTAQKYWFTPTKDKWTALLFIEKIASHSSLSNKSYLVKLNSGDTVLAQSWLLNKLYKIECR
ncbi:MAG: DUF5329 domain-containing protein [Pseudomonadales bacterium]|nr:DUF5329 domain-containing protein [Pseudomonadales bacterium]